MSDEKKITAVIDPRGAGDAKIREMLREFLDSPDQFDACVVILLVRRKGDEERSTRLDVRNTSDIELGYMTTYLTGYAYDRIRGGHA